RDIGRMVLAAEGRKANDSHADCYQYFCVPEYGTANGRLHFHAVHFMRTLPTRSEERRVGKECRLLEYAVIVRKKDINVIKPNILINNSTPNKYVIFIVYHNDQD